MLCLEITLMEELKFVTCKLKSSLEIGGETGIRTPEPVAQLLPFQGSAIDHSAISPADR